MSAFGMGVCGPLEWVFRGGVAAAVCWGLALAFRGRLGRRGAWGMTAVLVVVSLPLALLGPLPLGSRVSWGGDVRVVAWIAMMAWMAGAGVVAAKRIAGLRLVRAWCRGESRSGAAGVWRRAWAVVAADDGVVRVRFVRGLETPSLWVDGGGVPWLLLPTAARRWDEGIRSRVCAHEIAHFRAGDVLLHRVWVVLDLVQWWNPVWWGLRGRLELEVEKCADRDALVRSRSDAVRYARDLVTLAGVRLGPAPSWAGAGGLEERVRALLAPSAGSGRAIRCWASVVVEFFLILLVVACVVRGRPAETAIRLPVEVVVRLTADPFPVN